MESVWDRTLDQYEKSILLGDVQGAVILRALILQRLKKREPERDPCDCPYPMPNKSNTCGFCGRAVTE